MKEQYIFVVSIKTKQFKTFIYGCKVQNSKKENFNR